MADKTVNQLTELAPADFGTEDLLLVYDSVSGTTRKATIDTVATVSGTKGGFTFTSGFAKRIVSGVNTAPIYVTDGEVNKWIPLDFSADAQAIVDQPWWPGANPSNGIDLFGGSALPYGVSRMITFSLSGESQSWSTAGDVDVDGTLVGTNRAGTMRFDELDTGTTNLIRIDMNITPQIANTTIEVGLWFQPKLTFNGANDGPAFALPGSPLFFGVGTVGQTFLARPTSSMYIASSSDQFAYAVPVFKSDNPVTIEPLSMLAQNGR